jgi:hypothetical protein
MREQILKASRLHFQAHIEKHKTNIDVMLNNPMAIHDHTDLMTAIEMELEQIAEYEDKLSVLEKYFINEQGKQ